MSSTTLFGNNWKSPNGISAIVSAIPRENITTSSIIVSLRPAITVAGNYDVFVEVPACGVFDRCSERVDNIAVSVFTTSVSVPSQIVLVPQGGSVSTMIKVFSGYFPASGSSLPIIVMSVSPDIIGDGKTVDVSLVAQAVYLYKVPTLVGLNGMVQIETDTSGVSTYKALAGIK